MAPQGVFLQVSPAAVSLAAIKMAVGVMSFVIILEIAVLMLHRPVSHVSNAYVMSTLYCCFEKSLDMLHVVLQ